MNRLSHGSPEHGERLAEICCVSISIEQVSCMHGRMSAGTSCLFALQKEPLPASYRQPYLQLSATKFTILPVTIMSEGFTPCNAAHHASSGRGGALRAGLRLRCIILGGPKLPLRKENGFFSRRTTIPYVHNSNSARNATKETAMNFSGTY